jgi:hypothetical protein
MPIVPKNYKGVLIPRLIEAGQQIEENPEDAIQYQHGLFCQLSLPRSKTDALRYERSYRRASVIIKAGELWNGREFVQQTLPYGAMPRLILAHINTEAVQRRTRFIDLEGSAARFMEKIGVRNNGTDFHTFKRQMKAVSAAEFVLGYTDELGRAATMAARAVKTFKGWTTTDERQGHLWPAELELSADYYDDLLRHAVPFDARAAAALKHSAMALDAYFFLSKRLYTLERPVRVAYAHFHEQFGQEYKSVKDFSREWRKAIVTAKFVYPMADIKPTKGGWILSPSPPPISGEKPRSVE